jgi:hypothetical protein
MAMLMVLSVVMPLARRRHRPNPGFHYPKQSLREVSGSTRGQFRVYIIIHHLVQLQVQD